MNPLTTAAATRLLQDWDEQQSAYVAHRENRFAVMLDVLRLHFPGGKVNVLDLACGPGAIPRRVLQAFPHAEVTAVDYDPILLQIATAVLTEHGTRARVVDADLATPDWPATLDARPGAVLSSTALHWLSPAQLLAVYQAAAALLPPGGVLLNADHLRFDDSSPTLRDLAGRHDETTQREGFAAGALDYAAWYAKAIREPELAALAPVRNQRFANRPPQPLASLEFHLAALHTAGFAEVGTVWQYLDDYVVFARR
ncbi:trans-aconitate 2-methyltransferase [Actinoplanes sp. TFC3]|uniref:class I SAM-dependent methyltransferase n=1 Tax=Actinoplanes sp. TFC3 TaxID=1710355 RepID=UPI000B1E4A9C|nr:class I SAM-dependent methyltransferase [Actinoplanes sp. TFC3]